MDSSTLDLEAGGTKLRRLGRVKITPADDEDVPWSQIRELDDRIEAVKQLEDTLGWLREKEKELHDVKLSILREAAYRQRYSRSSPDSASSRARKTSAPVASAVTPSKYPRVRSKALVVHRAGLVKAVGTHCNAKGGSHKSAAVQRSPTAAASFHSNNGDDDAVVCKFHTAGNAAPDSPPAVKPQAVVRRRVSFADDWQADGENSPTAKASGTGGRQDASAVGVDDQFASQHSSNFPEFSPSPQPGYGFFSAGSKANKVMGDGGGGKRSTRGSKGVMRGGSQRGGYLSKDDSMVAGEAFVGDIPDPPTTAPPSPPPPPARPTRSPQRAPASAKKDITLRKMHDLLTNSLWDMDVEGKSEENGASRREGAAARSSSTVATSKILDEDREAEETAPSVWVTGYVDKLNNFGLGFLLSDGSVGVAFNSGITMVLQPTGESFDHIKRARSSSRRSAGRGRGEAGLIRTRYSLNDSPHKLRKHVILLKDLRKYIHNVDEESGESVKDALAIEGEQGVGGDDEGREGTMIVAQKRGEEPMPFVQQFYRTRWMVLFGLSNGTVQVLFSDRSELLLSDEARIITYVSKHGKREAFTLRRVLWENRRAVVKRVRCCNRLIARALRGSN